LKLPQAPVLPQVAVQLMPSLPELAVAAKFSVAPVFSVDEGAVEIEIVIGVAFTTVTVAVAVFVESLVEVALIVIVLPTADEDEARKVAAVPFDV